MHYDPPNRYSRLTCWLHWGMFALLILLFASAIAAKSSESLRPLINAHKACGILFMLLAIIRTLWAIINRRKRPAHQALVRLGHMALYLFMLAVPITAIIRQAGAGHSWTKTLGDQWHGELAFTFLAIIAGHIIMAIWHQYRGENILQRISVFSGARGEG